MVTINIDYKPFPYINYTRKKEGSFPSSFAELSSKQLIAISKFVNGKLQESHFLHAMTGFRLSLIKKLERYHLYHLMSLFEPFTELKPYDHFIIPEIITSTGKIVSPKPKLANITFAQFIFIESYFESYQNENKPIDLYKFIASLYLPQNTSFNDEKIIPVANKLHRVKPEILDSIFLNYLHIKEWLALAYPLILQSNSDKIHSDQQQKNKMKTAQSNNWLKIFENIVGDDLVNYDRYSLLPLHNVLRWMTNKYKENMKRK